MINAIEVSKVHKAFGDNNVLVDVSLEIKKGDIYGLLGANGAGKTTLMKIMLDILKPSDGSVKVMGSNVGHNNSEVLSKVGNIIEVPVFYEALTVGENLSIHCEYIDIKYKKDIPDVLELVGLTGIQDRKVKELSLGMKQRLAIGRAILCRPEVLVLDEPINGLDPKGIVDIREIITKLNKENGMTIIISSHIINEIEKVANTIGIIHNGQLIEEIGKERLEDESFDLERHFLGILQ